ncbi:serine/threonine protein kinase [Streptomyces sp. NBC_01003]|uniref:serine/threonine-protein kinase n=1 Tax=Streptomyces sp. NBC_01003 TaxID=2903714 RepID=UPI0038656543|nr:serine/threonine protein kinase [Streptomyces sp. NBC_01003]
MTSGEKNGSELIGKVLGGRYRVTSMIGRGGMGVVARAVDELLDREVAVKILRAFTDSSASDLAGLRVRMQREAQAAARIRHNGVVTVHDVTEEDGLPVIVMELVDGPSLDDVLTERGALEPHEAAAIGAKLMDALDAAHRAGVLHRDVKPGNVLLEDGGRVVLTDFGIASMEAAGDDAMDKLTRSGQLVGSLDYLPPERAQGKEPGPASDIWSLGMTLYAAVEGTSPFRRTSVWSTLAAIVNEPLPESGRAGALAPVLRALMAKDPESRPDAGQAREMLERVAAGSTVSFGPPAQAQAQGAVPAPHAVHQSGPGFGSPAAPYPQPPQGGGHPAPGLASTLPQSGEPTVGRAAGRASGRARRRSRAVIASTAAAVVIAGGGITYALVGTGDDTKSDEARTAPTRSGASQVSDLPSRGSVGGGKKSPSASSSATSQAPSRTPSQQPSEAGDEGAGDTDNGGGSSARPSSDGGATASQPPAPPTSKPSSVSKSCSGWTHRDPNPGTYGYMSGSYHIVTGPYQTCSSVALAENGSKLWYHCSVVNAYGHNWTYVRVAGTNTSGWMSNDNLTNQSGASTRC